MPKVTLFPLDQRAAEELAADPEAFARARDITLVPTWPMVVEIAAQTARFLAATPARAPWGAYLTLEMPERRLVGTCAFKGNPDAGGIVEIAYFTFPGEEGRGLATTVADALFQIASDATPPAVVVRAHTLPEVNASGRVLEKAGFRHLGEVIEPEDGRVWRWERPVHSV